MSLKGFRVSRFTVISLIVVGICLLVIWFDNQRHQIPPKEGQMKLTSSAFSHNNFLPPKYTCDGEAVNPPLTFDGVIPGTQSLALIVDDPDAPGGDWVHWLVWDIGPETKEISENSVPLGAIEGKNSFGDNRYGAPCPPSGTHRYQFHLYALNTVLADKLTPLSTKADLINIMSGHILDQVLLTGLYSKH